MEQMSGKDLISNIKQRQAIVFALAFLIILSLAVIRIVCHAVVEPSIAGDGWGYFKRAFYIHETGRLPPLDIQPVGYSILLAKLAFLGREGLLQMSVRIQQSLDIAIILALVYFSWLLSFRLADETTRAVFLLLSSLILFTQPFTAKLSNSIYTEPSVMASCFLGIGLFSLAISRNSSHRSTDIICLSLGGISMGVASIMRVDVLALNTIFILAVTTGLASFKLHSRARKAAYFLVASLIFPLFLLLGQLHSTGELGFQTYSKKSYPIEFVSWIGSWRADRREHQTFAWFSSSLDNLDTGLYPSKAFVSSEEKKIVESLFRIWKQQGYNDTVRLGFKEVIKYKRQSRPFEYYIINPLYRMYHHWVNLEGADFFLVSFRFPSGFASRLLVAFIFILRITILLLSAYGAIVFFQKVRHKWVDFGFRRDPSQWNAFRSPDWMIGLSMLFVLVRTLEMGALSTLHAGGLMEPRYVSVAFPLLLIVSLYGLFQLVSLVRGITYRGPQY